ncbi:MAG TPA: 30S ribosomal protein S16 [Chitinophagales bacterium]|nr:30S ribosomal protein S16 [Chitinophagales bacterium]
MSVKIRLQRHGKKGKPFYKIVAADSRAKRDGKFIEALGSYNPTTVPATIELNVDRSVYWLQVGAEPTDTVKSILQFKGALYKKHLLRGVDKGSFSAEDAEVKFNEWIANKNQIVETAQESAKSKKQAAYQATIEAGKERAQARLKSKEVPAEEAPEEAEATETPEAEESAE